MVYTNFAKKGLFTSLSVRFFFINHGTSKKLKLVSLINSLFKFEDGSSRVNSTHSICARDLFELSEKHGYGFKRNVMSY